MGTAKRSRKIRSGNKRVRRALMLESVKHNIEKTIIIQTFKTLIATMSAQNVARKIEPIECIGGSVSGPSDKGEFVITRNFSG